MYTTAELSEKLFKNGCELAGSGRAVINQHSASIRFIASYDIIYDICIKYAKEFFGDYYIDSVFSPKIAWHYYPVTILYLLQQGKDQKEIEEYIWDNCLFNPKNKEEESDVK